MFDFNDVIENNNIIDNIQHDFLDINVMFFNCYKLLIKAELQDNNWYVITNLVGRFDQTENKRNGLITHEIFESLLDTEFKYTGMLKNKIVCQLMYILPNILQYIQQKIFLIVYILIKH